MSLFLWVMVLFTRGGTCVPWFAQTMAADATIADKDTSIAELEAQVAGLTAAAEANDSASEELQLKLAKIAESYNETTSRLQQEIESTTAAKADVEAELQTAKDDVATLMKEAETAAEEAQDARVEMEQLEQQLAAAQAATTDAEHAQQALETQVAEVKQQLEDERGQVRGGTGVACACTCCCDDGRVGWCVQFQAKLDAATAAAGEGSAAQQQLQEAHAAEVASLAEQQRQLQQQLDAVRSAATEAAAQAVRAPCGAGCVQRDCLV